MKKEFNDIWSFEKELTDILCNLIIDKLRVEIKKSLEEHDIEKIKKIILLLKQG